MAGGGPAPIDTEVAHEVGARLQALGWSVSEAARRTGVSRVALSQICNGRRMPSVRTYERLRRGLGLVPAAEILTRPAAPTTVTETHLSRLAACVLVRREVALADLATACGVGVPAVRESLAVLQPRLAACGLRLVEDTVRVTVVPEPHAVAALAALEQLEAPRDLSPAALEVLSWVAYRGAATRAEIERARGQDCAALCTRLHARDYLDGDPDEEAPGRPYRYRLTTRAIATFGASSLAELQQRLAAAAAKAADVDGAIGRESSADPVDAGPGLGLPRRPPPGEGSRREPGITG
ncbi:MAG TPA: SMC-Scp complex subunit ScpB [Candidatus Dormibacteraeota bacterium]|nr:SMC-Scp complex subunit ScpB [Candidatus Dormibacteraeota bacterium]